MTAAERAIQLRAEIAHHNERYYGDDAPEVSDADYDALVRELRALEDEHPELVDAASPTQQVAAAPSTTFAPVVHRVPMTSLDNAMDIAELQAWSARVAGVSGLSKDGPTCHDNTSDRGPELPAGPSRVAGAAKRGGARAGFADHRCPSPFVGPAGLALPG